MASPPTRAKLSTGPSKHVYDVIVFGGQLGGPLSAALLQKRGYRVLLVEHDGLGHGYEHDGFILPYAPFVSPPLKSMPVVEDALKELGINTTLHRALAPHHPELQLIFDKHRLDLHADPQKRKTELLREFGEDGAKAFDELTRFKSQHEQTDAFVKNVQDLPPVGFLGGWKAKREIGRHPEIQTDSVLDGTSEVSKLLRRMLPFVTWQDAPGGPLAETRPLSQVLNAPNRFPGGREGVRELLVKRLQDLGGHVLSRDNAEAFVVENLQFDGDKVTGVQVLQSHSEYRTSAAVAATDSGAVRRLVADKKRHRKLLEQLDQVQTKRFLFAVNWVVPAELLPRGMGELVLMETGDELESLLIQQHGVRKATGEDDPSLRVVCAGAFVPANTRDLGEKRLEELKAQIDAHLERLMPFVKPKRVLASAPYLDAGGVRGSRLLPHPLLEVDAERYAGISGLSPKTAVKNLFLANREVLPGLGLEGELLAGVRAAKLVHLLLNKNKNRAIRR